MTNESSDYVRGATIRLVTEVGVTRAKEIIAPFCRGEIRVVAMPPHMRTEYLRYLEIKYNIKVGDF